MSITESRKCTDTSSAWESDKPQCCGERGVMGLLLIFAIILIFLEGKLILQMHSRIERLTGSRRELKAENARLRKEVDGIVLRVKAD